MFSKKMRIHRFSIKETSYLEGKHALCVRHGNDSTILMPKVFYGNNGRLYNAISFNSVNRSALNVIFSDSCRVIKNCAAIVLTPGVKL